MIGRMSAISPTPACFGIDTRTGSPPSPSNGWNSASMNTIAAIADRAAPRCGALTVVRL